MFDLRKKFFEKIRLAPSGCIEWTAARNAGGYGVMGAGDGRTRLAHHISWFLKHGRWPADCLLHRCDNPGCVRIGHLFEGSRADNAADKVAKGRQPTGESVSSAKLSNAQVVELRRRAFETNERLEDIARDFGINIGTASQIIQGKHRPYEGGIVGRKRFRYDVGEERLTVDEIAERAGVPTCTIAHRIYRGVTGHALVAKPHAGPRKEYTRRA